MTESNEIESVFHYTDLNAIKGIIDNRAFWLTHVHFMNDHTEYDVNLRLIEEGLKKKVEEYAGAPFEGFKSVAAIADYPVYLASFCVVGDLLSQWARYCPKSGGYALELDFDLLANQVGSRKDSVFQQCSYIRDGDYSAIEERISEIFEIFLKTMQGKQSIEQTYTQLCNSIILSVQFKDYGFREENEIRLVSTPGKTRPNFRTRGPYLIPYQTFKFDVNAIKNIIIGPMVDQELARKGVSLFLKDLVADKKHPLKRIPEISLSKIPLRHLS